MSSDAEKIFGYTLFCVGLVCILFALFSIYNVFTDSAKPPTIFKMQKLSFTTSAGRDSPPMEINMPLDSDARKIVNVFLYYLFMLFIVTVGSRLSSLGVQFIKEIKVEMKS